MTVNPSDWKAAEAYLELLRAIHISVMEMGVPMAHQRSIGNTVTSDPGEWAEGLDTRLPKTSEIGNVPFDHPVESDLFIKQADVLANQWGLPSYNSIVDNLRTLGVATRELMYAWDVKPEVIPATRGGSSSGRAGFNPNVGLQNETVYTNQFYTQNPFSEKPGIFEAGYTHGVYRPNNVLTGRQGTFVGPNTEEVLASGGDPRRPGVKLRPNDNWEDERKWMQAEQNTLLNRFTSSNQELKIDPQPAKMPHEGKFDHLIPLIPNSGLEWGLELGIGMALGPAGRAAMGKAVTSFTRWLNPANRLKSRELILLPDGTISRSTPRLAGADQGPNPIGMIRRDMPDPSDYASVREYEIALEEWQKRAYPDPGVKEFTDMVQGSGGDNIVPLNRAANREEWDDELMELEHQMNEYENYIRAKTAAHGGMTPKQIRQVLDELSQSDLLDDAFYNQNAERIQSLWDRAAPMIDDDPWRDPNTLAEALSLFKQEHKANPIKGGMGYEYPEMITKEDLLSYMRTAITNRERRALHESPEWGIEKMEEMLEGDSPEAGINKLLDEINSPKPDEWDEGITDFVKRVSDEMGIPRYDGWDSFMANAADADYQKIKDLGFDEDWLRTNVHNDDQLAQFFELIDMDVNVQELDRMIADYDAQIAQQPKDPYFGDGITDDEIIDGLDLSTERQPFNQDDEILPDGSFNTGETPKEQEALAKFLRERKYHLDDVKEALDNTRGKSSGELPINTGSGSGPGKGKVFDQDSVYGQENSRRLYGWLLAGAGGAAVTTWLATNPDHVSKLIDFTSKLGNVIGKGARGTGHQSIDSLNPGLANQIFGMNSALAGSTIIAGAEDPSIFDGMNGELRRIGQNPEKVLPKDVQIDLQNGDAVFVGYDSMKDQEEAISLAPRFGVEVSADLPHIWRKPNRKTIIPPADQGWDSDRLKKFAMQQQFYPDAGLRRRT